MNACSNCSGTVTASRREVLDPELGVPEGREYKKVCSYCGASVIVYIPIIQNPIKVV